MRGIFLPCCSWEVASCVNVILPKIVSELIGTLTPDTQKRCIYRSYNHHFYWRKRSLYINLVELQQFIAMYQILLF